jgi:hypothetical protein
MRLKVVGNLKMMWGYKRVPLKIQINVVAAAAVSGHCGGGSIQVTFSIPAHKHSISFFCNAR